MAVKSLPNLIKLVNERNSIEQSWSKWTDIMIERGAWTISQRAMEIFQEGFKEKQKLPKKCDCSTQDLMIRGCTCGGV